MMLANARTTNRLLVRQQTVERTNDSRKHISSLRPAAILDKTLILCSFLSPSIMSQSWVTAASPAAVSADFGLLVST